MNLDNLDLFKQIDTQNLLAEIDALPIQLQQAWELGQTLPLPDFTDIQNIVFAGMGDSAVAAELVTASVFSSIHLPVTVHRGYGLPAFANGKQALVVCISHSDNTEEILDAFETALKNDCQILVISTGGELMKRALAKNIPVWSFEYKGNAYIAYPFGLLLAFLARHGFTPNPSNYITEAVTAMKISQEHIRAEVVAAQNPAKRYAGQLVGRWVTFVGTENSCTRCKALEDTSQSICEGGCEF